MNHRESTVQNRGARAVTRRSEVGQRWGVLLGGGALTVYGLSRRSPLGLALAASGGALVYAGVRSSRSGNARAATTSVLINASPQEVYRFWRDFENLPRFMRHLESVVEQSDGTTRWSAIGPMGVRVHWTAETIHERPGESISWRSLPGSDIDVQGTVSFRRGTGDRGTEVKANISYSSPRGQLGHSLSKLMGKDPHFIIEQDLRRMKALMETGELPTIEGQSHGRRDVATAVVRTMDPDRPYRGDISVREALSAKRRAS